MSSGLDLQLLYRSKVAQMLAQQCPYVFVLQYENFWILYGSHIQNAHVKLFSGADSCHIQVLYVSPKSPAVQRVVLEAPTVSHMSQNQHDKLLITSGHLSVRVRPSVAQWGWTIPRNTVTQPPPAVWLNGRRCLKASARSLGPLTHGRCHSDNFNKRFSPTPDWHWATLLLSFVELIRQPQYCSFPPQSYFYRHAWRSWGQKTGSAKWTQWCFQQKPMHWAHSFTFILNLRLDYIRFWYNSIKLGWG